MNRNILSLILAGGMLFTACAPKEKPAGDTAAATASETVSAIPVRVMHGCKDQNCPHN